MGEKNIQSWAAEACRRIEFFPDRKAMERELTDHFADHRDALLESGMNAADAEELALRALGDAEEVGEQLAQVYNTVWTRLWRFSRGALFLLVILFVLFRVLTPPFSAYKIRYFDLDFLDDSAQMYYDRDAYEAYNEGFTEETIGKRLTLTNWTAGKSDAAADYMGFHWTVKNWAHMDYTMEYNDLDPNDGPPPVPDSYEGVVLLLCLRDSALYPDSVNFENSDFHAVDNRGTQYQFAGRDLASPRWSMGECGRVWNRYYIQLTMTPVAEDVEWVELRAGSDEDGLRLRINLTEGEVLG